MEKLFINFILFFISISIIILNIKIDIKEYNYIYKETYDYLDKLIKEETKEEILESFNGVITAYNPYCTGCIGITSSGYDVKNTIYYNDKEYGKIRIVAIDKKYKFGSIIKLSNMEGYDDIIAIALDRGSLIGNNKKSQIDLLFKNKEECINFGRKDVLIEILRYGY